MLEILKETIQSLPRVFISIDVLDQPPPPPRLPTGAPRVTTRIRSGVTKHSSIPYRETTFDDNIMSGFNESVRMPASLTYMEIEIYLEIYLEMRLDGGTDPDAMGDELRADIARTVPEGIAEM